MRVVLDARWIFPRISGVGAHTSELLRRLPFADPGTSYIALFNDRAVMDRTLAGMPRAPNFSAELVPWGVFSAAGQVLLPSRLRRLGADVFHSTNYMIPLAAFPRRKRGRVACVVTIHDVIPMLFRDHAPRALKSRLYPVYAALMREVGRRADRIITVSEASAADVTRLLRLEDDGKVRVVLNGVPDRFLSRGMSVAPRPAGGRPSLLYMGRMDPYKNVCVLVRALRELRDRHSVSAELTIVGEPDPRYPEASDLARELGVSDLVRFAGYLADDALVEAYCRADVMVHASRYEGFGLQVLEAMAVGLPVVCGDGGALPEVAGDAAVVVPSNDPSAFADAVARVLSDGALARSLIERGRARAARFTWDRAAAATAAVYRELAGEGGAQ